jgi:transcriptional regulator with XRE-family HTH domain
MDASLKTPEDLRIELGAAIKATRLAKNLTQRDVAAKADVAVRALIQLEAGRGSTTDTLVRALKAMGAADLIGHLVPSPGISPIALLKASKVRMRARRPRPRYSDSQ